MGLMHYNEKSKEKINVFKIQAGPNYCFYACLIEGELNTSLLIKSKYELNLTTKEKLTHTFKYKHNEMNTSLRFGSGKIVSNLSLLVELRQKKIRDTYQQCIC